VGWPVKMSVLGMNRLCKKFVICFGRTPARNARHDQYNLFLMFNSYGHRLRRSYIFAGLVFGGHVSA